MNGWRDNHDGIYMYTYEDGREEIQTEAEILAERGVQTLIETGTPDKFGEALKLKKYLQEPLAVSLEQH
jgi:hypothetical protein